MAMSVETCRSWVRIAALAVILILCQMLGPHGGMNGPMHVDGEGFIPDFKIRKYDTNAQHGTDIKEVSFGHQEAGTVKQVARGGSLDDGLGKGAEHMEPMNAVFAGSSAYFSVGFEFDPNVPDFTPIGFQEVVPFNRVTFSTPTGLFNTNTNTFSPCRGNAGLWYLSASLRPTDDIRGAVSLRLEKKVRGAARNIIAQTILNVPQDSPSAPTIKVDAMVRLLDIDEVFVAACCETFKHDNSAVFSGFLISRDIRDDRPCTPPNDN